MNMLEYKLLNYSSYFTSIKKQPSNWFCSSLIPLE